MSVLSHRPYAVLHAPSSRGEAARGLLLWCGVAFPLLWVGTDLIASQLYQVVSELSAYDAPTRALWLVSGTLGGVLALGFAGGVWQASAGKRELRIVAGLIAVVALINLVLGPFSSMHQREVLAADGGNFSDTLHLALVAVGGVAFVLESGFAASAFGWRFRVYSALTVLNTLIAGFLTSLYTDDVSSNLDTPWVGMIERVSAYAYELWVVVFALALLRTVGNKPEGRTR